MIKTVPTLERRIALADAEQQNIIDTMERVRLDYQAKMEEVTAEYQDSMDALKERANILNENSKLYRLMARVRDNNLELRYADTGKPFRINFS